MSRYHQRTLGALALFSVLATAVLDAVAAESDLYSAAVAHPGRSESDLKRDRIDHPAELLRLAASSPVCRSAICSQPTATTASSRATLSARADTC